MLSPTSISRLRTVGFSQADFQVINQILHETMTEGTDDAIKVYRSPDSRRPVALRGTTASISEEQNARPRTRRPKLEAADE